MVWITIWLSLIVMLDLLWKGLGIIYTSDREKNIAQEIAFLISNTNIPVVVSKIRDLDIDRMWECFDGFIFISPLSVVIRSICKKLKHKTIDPPVVVVDPSARYVIPILGAHWGGNDIALELSKLLNLQPVITTASEAYSVTSVEQVARLLHCFIENIEKISVFDSVLINGEEICVYGVNKLPSNIRGRYVVGKNSCRYVLHVYTNSEENFGFDKDVKILKCRKYKISIGIGCHSDTNVDFIVETVKNVIKNLNIDVSMIKHLVSTKLIVNKAAEILGLRFKFVSFDELNKIEEKCLTPPSQNLLKYGVRGVAELCALYGCDGRSHLVFRKRVFNRNVTIAVAGCGD